MKIFSNDMDLNIFIALLHELVELKRYSSYKNDDSEYILISENSEEGEGQSGQDLELCFGKYNRKLISSLIIYIKDKG